MQIRYVIIDRDLEPTGTPVVRGWGAFTFDRSREWHYFAEYRAQLTTWSLSPSIQGYRQYGYQWDNGAVARGYGIP